MEKLETLKELLNLPPEQQIFFLAISTIGVIGFALYVVLVAIKVTKTKGDC